MANASFSIWVYVLSVGVVDLDAYATGPHSPYTYNDRITVQTEQRMHACTQYLNKT